MKSELTVAIIDHDDSFTHNLRHWLFNITKKIDVINHREISNHNLDNYNLIVLSPGPKHPNDYPHMIQWLNSVSANKPILAVCLGMQLMTLASGGKVESYTPPLHGKTSLLQSTFTELNEIEVARYHSLKCRVSNDFDVIATSDAIPMWIQHRHKKWLAFQFHPESFLTTHKMQIQNYIFDWLSLT